MGAVAHRRGGFFQAVKRVCLLVIILLCLFPLFAFLQQQAGEPAGDWLRSVPSYRDFVAYQCAEQQQKNGSSLSGIEGVVEFESVQDVRKDEGVVKERGKLSGAELVEEWLQRMDDISEQLGLCGSWQKEYAKLHRQIRAEAKVGAVQTMPPSRRRYVVWYCVAEKFEAGGLGDRLIGMATALLFAVATNRCFVVYWPHVGDVYRPGEVDWSYDEVLNAGEFPDRFPGRLQWAGLGTGNVRMQGPEMGLLNVANIDLSAEQLTLPWLINTTDPVRVLILRMNRGRVSHYLKASDTLRSRGFIQPHATGCLLRYLLRPTPTVVNVIAPKAAELLSPGTFRIAIHTRLGDFWFKRAPDAPPIPIDSLLATVKPMIECAHLLASYWMPNGKRIAIFYASEVDELKVTLRKLLPDRVTVTEGKMMHINKPEGLVSSVAEWYLLAMCDVFVISRSGLSRTAAFYGLGEKKIYQFPRDMASNGKGQAGAITIDAKTSITNLAHNTSALVFESIRDKDIQKSCKPWEPFSLERLEADWSGM